MPEKVQTPVQDNKKAATPPQQKVDSTAGDLAYADFRTEVVSLKSMQAFADDSRSGLQITQLQALADASNRARRTTQLQAMADSSSSVKRITQLQEISSSRQTHQFSQHKPIQLKGNNTGLPDNLKSGIENLSGVSMDSVKVHKNSDKPAQLNAHAYAQGTDIHLGAGQEKHLPHEAWHVVQQSQGRVQPTTQLAGVNINDNTGLEKEADVMGSKALQMKTYDTPPTSLPTINGGNDNKAPFQLAPAPEKIKRYEKAELDAMKSSDVDELDKDLWFKSSPDIEKVESTKELLPKHEGISKAFHTTTREHSAKSILERIDPRFHNPASRFGGGFYAATDMDTSYAELAAHEFDNFKKGEGEWGLLSAVETIEYSVSGGDLVDATQEPLASIVKKEPLTIEKKVREDESDGIVFNSTKGSGQNIVLFKNYGIMKSKSPEPARAAKGFSDFKGKKDGGDADIVEKQKAERYKELGGITKSVKERGVLKLGKENAGWRDEGGAKGAGFNNPIGENPGKAGIDDENIDYPSDMKAGNDDFQMDNPSKP